MTQEYGQIKINIPLYAKEKLESKASMFGLTLSGYIKYLVIRDMETELRKQSRKKTDKSA